jgi:hypothetical protein
LEPAHLWTALRGGVEIAEAIAAGAPMASEGVMAARVSACERCPSRRVIAVEQAGLEAAYGRVERWWCGEPVRGGMTADGPTCGCLVAMTVGGQEVGVGDGGGVRPAAKAVLAESICPQGRWPVDDGVAGGG